jgi:transcription-repair coupling factor (superfamily II helicase)
MSDIVAAVTDINDLVPDVVEGMRSRRGAALSGAGSSAHGFLAVAALRAMEPRGPALVVAATPEAAERLALDMAVWSDRPVRLFPASDLYLPGADPVAAQRMETLAALDDGAEAIVVASLPAVLQRVTRKVERLTVKQGDTQNLGALVSRLAAMGYERSPMVHRQGQFSVRGGILDIFPSTEETPVRADFFGDQIESLRRFDPDSQRSTSAVDQVAVLPTGDAETEPDATLLDYLAPDAPAVVVEVNAVQAQWEEFVRAAEAQYAGVAKDAEDSVRLRRARPIGETHADPGLLQVWLAGRRRLYLDVLQRANPWEEVEERFTAPSLPVDVYRGRMDSLARTVTDARHEGLRVVMVSAQVQRLQELMAEQGVTASPDGSGDALLLRGEQRAGFRLPDLRLLTLTDAEIFGEREVHIQRRRIKDAEPISSLLELKEGDFVVHVNHGIGHFRGLSVIRGTDGVESEFLRIDYAGGDKVYVPTSQMDRVQKYIGNPDTPPTVNRLGGPEWARATARARARARDMARELIALYAVRQKTTVVPCGPDTSWQQEMENGFPYEETPDQARAVQEVKADLQKPHPMDRLLCGDVGFGKTEVAIRAAFKVVSEGKQVAVLVPTTILAEQHWNTFKERLAAFPLNIEMLNRFRTPREQKAIVRGLRDGTVDVVIGTHRLLSKDVEFRDLGLLVVDEEQRFGVSHKERIKQLRKNVHVLTLTATPIPRTLHMSLTGIRDMSVMMDPPEGRTPIKTVLTEYSDSLVREAVLHEMDRGGQVYLVHNRVENIHDVAEGVRRLVPTARVGVGHGQMGGAELEQVMWDFYHRKFDVLVCTTIIENGLDVPNANTIIVNNADRFGLAQLYQLRGRVGRSPRQAFCYLLYRPYKEITEEAAQRLQAIREFSELGSGFRIAMRDLEIRGAGNLLGAEQSGMVASVGFEYYCQLIQQAVNELKGEEPEEFVLPPADIPVPALIPETYVEDDATRIAFYKKVTAVRDHEDLKSLQEEFEDRFGDPPAPVWNMLRLLDLRLSMREGGIVGLSGNQYRVIARLGRNLRDDERWDIQRRRKRWIVDVAAIETPVQNGDPLRTAEEFVPRVIADITGNPSARRR